MVGRDGKIPRSKLLVTACRLALSPKFMIMMIDAIAPSHVPSSRSCIRQLRVVIIAMDQQPLFQRRRQLPTSVIYDRLPGYMKPTFGSSQKATLKRCGTLQWSGAVTSRPRSSPVTLLSSSLNLPQVAPSRALWLL